MDLLLKEEALLDDDTFFNDRVDEGLTFLAYGWDHIDLPPYRHALNHHVLSAKRFTDLSLVGLNPSGDPDSSGDARRSGRMVIMSGAPMIWGEELGCNNLFF